MTKTLTYNIPGNGNIKALLCDHTIAAYDFLENYGHITKLKKINQLGRLLNVFPGAHHTRYEYVYLQWALITELIKQKGNHGLGSARDFYGKIDSCRDYPSSAEILQCLALITNIGYSEATFAGNRAWLFHISQDVKLKRKFKSGLPPECHQLFEQVVESFDFYNFQHLSTLFLLQRYKRTSNGHVEFLTKLLIGYLLKEQDNIHKIKIWELFKNIRKMAFLTLDALYTPVPFSIRLSSIVLSFDEYYEDMILNETNYTQALSELEVVLQNSVYLLPSSLLCTSKSTCEIIESLELKKDKFYEVSELKCLLQDTENDKTSIFDIDWNQNQILTLCYENVKGFFPSDILKSPIAWENSVNQGLGKTKSLVAIAPNPGGDNVKIAVSINPLTYKDRLSTTLKFVQYFKTISDKLSADYKNPKDIENSRKLLEIILKSVFGFEKRFILESGDKRYNPVFVENGKAKMKKAIENYKKNMSGILTVDELFEVEQLIEANDKFGYSGLMIGFAGATKVLTLNNSQLEAEFDGLLIKPNKSITEEFMYIIEAKNYTNGFTDAQRQLENRLNKLLPSDVNSTIHKMNPRAAISIVKAI